MGKEDRPNLMARYSQLHIASHSPCKIWTNPLIALDVVRSGAFNESIGHHLPRPYRPITALHLAYLLLVPRLRNDPPLYQDFVKSPTALLVSNP